MEVTDTRVSYYANMSSAKHICINISSGIAKWQAWACLIPDQYTLIEQCNTLIEQSVITLVPAQWNKPIQLCLPLNISKIICINKQHIIQH